MVQGPRHTHGEPPRFSVPRGRSPGLGAVQRSGIRLAQGIGREWLRDIETGEGDNGVLTAF